VLVPWNELPLMAVFKPFPAMCQGEVAEIENVQKSGGSKPCQVRFLHLGPLEFQFCFKFMFKTVYRYLNYRINDSGLSIWTILTHIHIYRTFYMFWKTFNTFLWLFAHLWHHLSNLWINLPPFPLMSHGSTKLGRTPGGLQPPASSSPSWATHAWRPRHPRIPGD